MGNEHKFPSALEIFSPGSPDYWFPKFVMGGLLLYPALDWFRLDHPASIFPCGLILSLSLTFLWLTRIKPEAEELKYRRFFEWKSIHWVQHVLGLGFHQDKTIQISLRENLFSASSRPEIRPSMGQRNHLIHPKQSRIGLTC